MKIRLIVGAAAVGSALAMCVPVMHAQMNGHSPAAQAANDPTRNGMQSSMGQGGPGGKDDSQDAMFLRNSAEASNGEIAAAQAALSKSSNDQVKQFAQKMIDDHNMLLQKAAPVAQAKGMTPPTTPDKGTQKKIAAMGNLNGDAFDKAYIKAQVSDHKKALSLFNAEIQNGKDPQVKQLAQDGKPTIQDHLKMAEDLEKNMK